ncbi:hypothetical protein [Bacillus thermotolerans]|uniref:hypothetical protein n=1 Tax=Bacillus thermotolerans TaxID=1221996 RepID=UPI000591EB37|nr:hypothetical protein [Bacillus thermotolerans]KKB37378.1 Aldehyde dehydrogenase [Bacillus thermotolerans]
MKGAFQECYDNFINGKWKAPVGRENHLIMLDDCQQTKNLLVSCSEDPLGFF